MKSSDEHWNYVMGFEDRAEEAEKDAAQEEDQSEPGWGKKKGKMYPCVECKKMFGCREMTESKRPKHAVVVEGVPDELTSEHAELKTVYQKICASCELAERHKELLHIQKEMKGREKRKNGRPVDSSTKQRVMRLPRWMACRAKPKGKRRQRSVCSWLRSS